MDTLNSEQLLEGLTEPQRRAVTHVDGPLLIVAGAGSGKTRVITRRVAYLVSLGIPAPSILAITFTNKAAGEMKGRVSEVLGRPVRDFGRLDQPWPTVCTFHSLCLRVLRHYAVHVGLPANFAIFDSSDQTKLIKEALKGLELSTTNFAPGTVHGAISNAKNQLVSAEQFAGNARDFYHRTVARVYTKYQELLKQNNALDFDDLLLRTAHAFRGHPEVLQQLQERFQYILIDEYQDTNHAQYIIAHALAQKHRNICVVGDPDQCLPPGTLVATPEGARPIETLSQGDVVLSGRERGTTCAVPVDRVMVRPFSGQLVRITTEDGAVRATPNHIGFVKWDEGSVTWPDAEAPEGRQIVAHGKPSERSECSAAVGTLRPSISSSFSCSQPRRGERAALSPLWGYGSMQSRSHGLRRGLHSLAPPGLEGALAATTAVVDGVAATPLASLTAGAPFNLLPLGQVFPGMTVPVYRGQRLVESVVTSVEWEDYDGLVYDLSVPDTRNYVAGGVVVHNSIYAWRGADIKNILEFERDYPDATVVRLEQNYRSTKTVLAIASNLIANNRQRKEKSLWTENPQGEPATLFLCQDEHDEAAVVTQQLRELHDKHKVPWSDMAIFYRMNSLSRVVEESLFKNKVPYQIARGVEFYNRKEIKDVLAYLRVVANPADEVSLDRIVNTPPRGLGEGSMKQIAAYAIGNGITLLNAMVDAANIPGMSTRAANGTRAFVELVRKWRRMAGLGPAAAPSTATSGPAADAAPAPAEGKLDGSAVAGELELRFEPSAGGSVRALMEDVVRSSGLEQLLAKADKEKEEGERAIDNVNELISSAAEFDRDNPDGTLADYLAQVTLVSDTDRMGGAGGAVTLMTLHAAKGLEFPVVAMVGLEEGVLPHSRARDNLDELEEERRLCFVGITRAQERLILSKAQFRTVRGLRERTVTSPFLSEMPNEYIRVIDRTGLDTLPDRAEQRDYERQRYERDRGGAGQIRKGQLVRHPMFGLGRVVDISDAGQHTRAVIDFNTAGRKTLILQYARLEAVG